MIQPLVRSATECIVHAVVADPRYAANPPTELGDLIVASMPSCVAPVRAMIDAYDRYYGAGAGQAFFMGPYLDVLPKVVRGGQESLALIAARQRDGLLLRDGGPDDVNHPHPGRIDDHDLILHHRIFVELGGGDAASASSGNA